MSYYQELQGKQKAIEALARKYGAANIRVFGSVARQEDTSVSDVDFLAEFEHGRSLLDLVGLKQDLEELLGRSVDVLTPDSLHWYVRDDILREAKLLSETVQ